MYSSPPLLFFFNRSLYLYIFAYVYTLIFTKIVLEVFCSSIIRQAELRLTV